MSRKENFLRVLRHEMPVSEVPVWELHFHIWEKMSGEKFISGKEFMQLSPAQQHDALKKDAEIMVKTGEKLGFSAVSIPDAPWDCVYTLPQHFRVELIENLHSLRPDFCIVAGCGAVISMPASSDWYMDFCYQMFDEPEEVDAMCKDIFDRFLVTSGEMIDAGADAIYSASDVADNRAPFFTREQQMRWYFPYLNKFADYLHSRNIPAILHTDGNIQTLLEDIRKSGVDGLQAIDPIAGMEIDKVQQFMENKVAVCGNLDCDVMLSAPPEKVYSEAKRILLSCKDHPGFIFGNSNAVAIETPKENYEAMMAAWREYGKL